MCQTSLAWPCETGHVNMFHKEGLCYNTSTLTECFTNGAPYTTKHNRNTVHTQLTTSSPSSFHNPSLSFSSTWHPPKTLSHFPPFPLSTHSHFLPIEQHAMDLLDRSVGRFLCLKVHKPVAFGLAHLILGHLAWKNVPKGTEGVKEHPVVNGLVQVLDEDVAHPRATEGGVTLRPHDSALAVPDDVKVHRVKSTLSCAQRGKGIAAGSISATTSNWWGGLAPHIVSPS